MRTVEGEAAPFVRYRLSQGNTQIFLLGNGIAYQFERTHLPDGYVDALKDGLTKDMQAPRVETGRMDVMLEGAALFPRITAEGRSTDHTNYYADDVFDVHAYTKVTHHDVYPGIDWVVYTTEEGIKQDFVVRPGADPSMIRMRHSDHEELYVDADGSLVHGNSMGRFTEHAPVSFQDGKEITTRFVVEGNEVRFALGAYDRTKELVIDPQRLWGTYYGGTGIDYGWSCTTDASGNVYMAGFTQSTNAIAASGHQNIYAGATDAFLVKFSSSGTRLWGTYYGGDGQDLAYGCVADASGNIYLAGTTNSTSGISSGGHQDTYAGGDDDGFLVKFNASGTRLWATYYGGPSSDRAFHCDVDPTGNVFLSGESTSTTGIAANGHQNTFGGGANDDAFLVKFSPGGTRLWATYYGGSGLDTGEAGGVDADGNVYIAGWTESSTGIASGGHQNTYAGGGDAYLAKFTPNGTRVWGTYYGSSAFDRGFRCGVEANGNVFLIGETSSTTGIATGGHQNTYGGGSADAFIAKFDPDGSRLWGSYYGGSGAELGYSCVVDASGNSYMAGYTTSTSNIASNGHQNTYGGGTADAFLVKFSPSGGRVWGTYYGGSGIEGGPHDGFYTNITVQCAVDLTGNVYLSGTTNSTSGIQSGSHQTALDGEFDAFLVKFEDRSITTGAVVGPICTAQAVSVPFTVSGAFNGGNTFTAQLSNASGSFASPVSIGTLSGTTNGIINASIPIGTAPGTGYRIRVVGNSPVVDGSDNGTNLTINDASTSCACSEVTELEPNNSVVTVSALPNNTPTSGIVGPCSLPDNTPDFFGFTTATQGVLTVQYCMSNTGPDPLQVTCRLLNSTGTQLASSSHTAGANNVTSSSPFFHICLGAGSYRIAIDNPSTDYCTNYTLTYSIEEPVFGNDPEPNDAIGASATPVAHDTYSEGRIGFLGEAPYDYFSFTPPTNGVLNIEVQAEHVQVTGDPLVVDLIDHLGTLIQSWDVYPGDFSAVSTTNLSIPCRSTVAPYYIRMSSTECGISYQWKYTMSPPLFAADLEPNNSVPGTAVEHDTYADGQLQFDGEGTYDYFNIVPPTSGVMSIEVQAEHVGGSTGTMEMALCNSAGTAIQTWTVDVGANSTATTTTVSIPCRSGTTNYNVRFASTTCGISYRWKYVMAAPLFTNDVEPNNDVNGDIEDYNTWYEGQVGFDNPADVDIFTIDPPNSGIMHIAVEAEHTGVNPGTVNVALLSEAGTVIQSWDMVAGANGVMEDSLVNVICRSGAVNYNLRFTPVTCGVSYRWKYTMTAPHFADDAEPNNSAPGISLAYDTFTEGQVQFDGDTYDYYTITPLTNGVMNFSVEAEHVGATTGAMELALLNSAGTVIQTWPLSVGANGVPQASAVSITCRSTVNPYRVRITSSTCGVSYRFKYTMIAPLFAVDAEPNNTQPGTALAVDTYTEGHIAFDAENAYDIYRIEQSANGRVNVELQAEHAGDTPGIMTVTLLSTTGTTVHTWSFPVGANGVPVTTILNRTCLSAPASYDLRLSSSVCGASYKLKYTVTSVAFANDIEPNNAYNQSTFLPETQTAQGQLNYPGQDNNDHYRGNISSDGVLNLLLEAEHTGPETNATMTVELYLSVGTVLQTWTAPIGANGVPISSVLNRPCLGEGVNYYFRLSSSICGTSYRISYTVTPPLFPNDAEPNNNGGGAGGPLVAHDTYQDGHLQFDGNTTTDQFNIIPPINGTMQFEVQAEHVGATDGSIELRLYNTVGGTIQFWNLPVGANGSPITSIVSIPCIGNTTDYDVRLASSTCGVSYRWKYTMIAPLFANDAEPNSTFGGSTEAHDTWYEGQIAHGTTDPDIYNLIPPINGIMNIELQAEHPGATEGDVWMILYTTTGGIIQSWSMPVGPNGAPIDTVVRITCLANTTDYDLAFYGNTCGVSYRWKYWMTAPVFAPDAEPNNGNSTAIPMNLNNAAQEGNVGFHGQTDDDLYFFTHSGGPWSVTLSAEHAGQGEGSLFLTVRTLPGTTVGAFSVPAGGSSAPLTNTFTIPSLGAAAYRLYISDVTCGVSYRIHCYDDDNDGTCNANDVCAGGPEPGTPCDDGDPGTINDVITSGCSCAGTPATVSVPVRVMLEGPYVADNGLMSDALRSLPAFPLMDPYPGLGYAHAGGGNGGSVSPAVLAVIGSDAIVDWVVVELRSPVAPATVVASRSALLQRDGDVVELDGLTPVAFNVSSGLYHVAVRHRNHLGAMTKDPVMVSAGTTLLDFSVPEQDTYGVDARKSISGSFPAHVLWSGDVSFDGVIRYVGEDNDRDPILVVIGGNVPTNTVAGVYSAADCDLDGMVKYVGDGNDRDPILVNIGGSVPTNTRSEQLP
ncbi:MAG: hypothetical protein H6591_05435 [Flavobacteriales bacterium]|nr:hypothetical protein [Flavobacteriales bacterium]